VFERFDSDGRKSVLLAQEESRRLSHNYVGTEQILLGLVADRVGVAARVLAGYGVNLKNARFEVEKIIGRGSDRVAVEIPFTPRAKLVLQKSWEESRRLGHDYVGTAHILLALSSDSEGVGVHVLQQLGVNFERMRKQLIERLPTATDETVLPEGRRSRKLWHGTFDILGTVADLGALECVLKDLHPLIKGSEEERDPALPGVLIDLKNSVEQLAAALEPQKLSELLALITELRKDIIKKG